MSNKMEVEEQLSKEVQIKNVLEEFNKFKTAAPSIAKLLNLAKHVCWDVRKTNVDFVLIG